MWSFYALGLVIRYARFFGSRGICSRVFHLIITDPRLCGIYIAAVHKAPAVSPCWLFPLWPCSLQQRDTWLGGCRFGRAHPCLSEIGVILLLFTLGIEFSASEIKNLKRPALIGGSIQVSLSALVATLAAYYWGLDLNQAIVAGFAFALSSTAVSMKCFQDMGAPDSPPGRVALGIALFQDLAVIFFIVLLPVLLDEDEGGAGALVFALARPLFSASR